MQKTLIDTIPIALPKEIESLVLGAKVYDSSCASGAKVFFIDKDSGYYLKTDKKGSLEREYLMTSYFHKRGIGAEVLYFGSNECDIMLTAKVQGEDCVNKKHTDEPKRLSILQGEELRKLHELDYSDCPCFNKMEEYVTLAQHNYLTDNFDKTHFPDNFGYSSAEEAYKVLMDGKSAFKSDVLVHGDYCLPNIILKDWKLSAFIDVGGAGVGDRHIDIFWGLWSLGFNLQTEKYNDLFLDAYGRDKIDKEILKIVASAEVFG